MSRKKVDSNVKCSYCNSKNVHMTQYRYGKVINSMGYKCLNCSKNFSVSINRKGLMRVLVISDTHCGHVTGLTPPEYNTGKDKYYTYRKNAWDWFKYNIKQLNPIDILIYNGDAIDGRQEKSGGRELLTGNRLIQCKMAEEIIDVIGAKKVYMTYGTPYHTGKEENLEDLIASNVGATIKNKLVLNINGCIFDVRHKTGRSQIPHGRFTRMALESIWNDLMNKSGEKANVIIRSHVHYHISGSHSNNRLFFTTPALQGASEYGDKECLGNVDFGIIKIDIQEQGLISDFKFIKSDINTGFSEIENVKL